MFLKYLILFLCERGKYLKVELYPMIVCLGFKLKGKNTYNFILPEKKKLVIYLQNVVWSLLLLRDN